MKQSELVKQIAKQTKFSVSHITNVLKGRRNNPSILALAVKIEEGVKPKVVKKDKAPDAKRGVRKLNTAINCDMLKRVREASGISKMQMAVKMDLTLIEIDNAEAGIGVWSIGTLCKWLTTCNAIIGIKFN